MTTSTVRTATFPRRLASPSFAAALGFALLAGCTAPVESGDGASVNGDPGGDAPGTTVEDVGTVESPYVIWQRSSGCLIRKALAPSIRMCVRSGGDLARAQRLTRESLLKWLDAIRPLNAQVTQTVEFNCTSYDGTLTVDNTGEYSYAGQVHVRESSAPGTYLHEFGHAFACLGDTYVNGTAAYCMAGQPHSIMCDGLLRNDLTADDIAGVQVQFNAMVAGTTAPPSTPGGNGAADGDGDGIPDTQDRCPSTPAGSHVWGDQYNGRWKGCAGGEVPVR